MLARRTETDPEKVKAYQDTLAADSMPEVIEITTVHGSVKDLESKADFAAKYSLSK